MLNSSIKEPGLLFVVLSVASLLTSILYRGYRTRRFYRDLPGPPHSWLWGHITIMRDIAASMPRNCMPQLYYTEIAHRYNIQGIFYLDLWPIAPGLAIITDPSLIDQAPIPKPLSPHPMTDVFMKPMVGKGNISAKAGSEWKKLHNAISPAFSTAQTRNLISVMINEIMLLRKRLDELSVTGEVFSMEKLMGRAIFGIVSHHVLNDKSYAQRRGSQDLADMRELIDLAREEGDPGVAYSPFVQIPRRLRRRRVCARLEASILDVIHKRFRDLVSEGVIPSRQNPTSILDLMLREHVEVAIAEKNEGCGSHAKLSKSDERVLLSSLRVLLMGGHNTSTTTLSFLVMSLSKAPHIVDKLRQEHSQQVGRHPQTTLLGNPGILLKLPYTEGVIKEALRLYVIGSSLRMGPPGATLCHQGRHLPIDNNLIIMTNAHSIHYDPKFYPQPTAFQPERWLDSVHPGSGCFRPFGGDGRWCTGQNLAMYMLRVIVVMIVGDYTFECADLKHNSKPRTLHTDIDVTFGDIAFQQLGLEGRPRDGMMMTVKKV